MTGRAESRPQHTDADSAPAVEDPGSRARTDFASVTIGVVLLGVFVAAFVNALRWQAIAGLFPLTVTALGAVLSAGFVLSRLGRRAGNRADPVTGRTSAPEGDAPLGGVVELAEEADQADAEHALLASLGRRDWLESLGWFAAFFAGLAVFGLYVATVVFATAYLRHQARSSWLLSVIYGVLLAAAMYALFGLALQLPVPGGALGLA